MTDANITGHVIEAETGEHLTGCLVKIEGTDFATVTDASGHYLFRDLNPGKYTITVSYTDYKPQKKEASVSADQTLELNFEVEPDAFLLDQVVITSSKTESLRRESASLVNVTSGKIFSTSEPALSPTASISNPACGLRTTVRTADSPRCA